MSTQPLNPTNYIGHDFGWIKKQLRDEPYQLWIDTLSSLVLLGKFDVEQEAMARQAIAARDRKAMIRLIRSVTTTKQLPEQRP